MTAGTKSHAAALRAPPRVPPSVLVGCMVAFVVALFVVTALTAFVVGVVVGETQTYHRRAERQIEEIHQVLRQRPDGFNAVAVHEGSSGDAYMTGSIESVDDFRFLESEMQRLFGEELAREMTRSIVSPRR